MTGFILGEKSEQSQTFNDKGERIPTTFIKTTNCYLLDITTPQKRGYFAVKLGFGQSKNIKKPVQGELTKAGIKTPLRFLKEIRLDFPVTRKKSLKDKVKLIEEDGKKGLSIKEVKIFVGEPLKTAALFKKGDQIAVSGISKGKGFQGVVKRHHFKGGPRTHGQSHSERAPGSVGMTTTPGRIFKGKRMAGRMGGERVTIKYLQVVEVKEEGLLIKGLVPGYRGALLEVIAEQ
ncbi:50S ribosomal protein L3 [Candidatus Roizmanbacteria bacterium CG22_combo_CG10-13_8_21_14_all_35_9]|uniref:Large ribosomal subunit protein uL3 n=4 Tax=Candidatus Roizmaniibacteriota TaxID=1752723 RepID=A0A2M8F4M7_9BACT|nr:MAG: 50S ribosomal protein L3 [Candidatus Roizmanbacteria bacterium CG23_combo_of_CG06-09_8_20_14_all_35_49]PIP62641.1 MAG: 50S ribosomal protein L3 [Candidatus Roizmanbacteria bacterium CG22_combo_CG10-13_8_21_14_all_35_9]PIY71196.1 MAG: 50S ribosomal protein L3 [Candidatus Roizmanbacteria bacterium CG_4_10_14_0_8_um_filter_35_28]PJC34232.1 MAG: 50S ribosomal protein L3 [Candidatus Roizmanbacteria bacterium CG_4_9_14_0_2_um_filter_35_15]PJC82624.1 MAG: 50S ribosomal protein L3 [Candidatus R